MKKIKLTEKLLNEANRQQLLAKSRKARKYSPKNQAKGKNRYERRNKSKIATTVAEYNRLNMDLFFKRDILSFVVKVQGETNRYGVELEIKGVLEEIQQQVKRNNDKLEFKVILMSLMKVFNTGDVFVGCSCPDARYRMAYNQTKNNYKAGYKETRPSNKTNPNDDLGAGCKHVLLVLANLDWAVKLASVINNYIKYCKEHLARNYADYIFPKVYGVQYTKAVQLSLFDDGLLPSDQDTIDKANEYGRTASKFKKGNQWRFKKKETPIEDENNPLGLKFNDDENRSPKTPKLLNTNNGEEIEDDVDEDDINLPPKRV